MDHVELDEQGRPEPPLAAGEVATLLGFLDFQRSTLAWKCAGLDDDQLRASWAPTSMTLGGLLKHLAFVEDYWFTEVVAGEPSPQPWASVDWASDPDWDWHSAAEDSAEDLRTLWDERVERSRAVWPAGSSTVSPRRCAGPMPPGAGGRRCRCGGCSPTWSRSTPVTTATPTCSARPSTGRRGSERGSRAPRPLGRALAGLVRGRRARRTSSAAARARFSGGSGDTYS